MTVSRVAELVMGDVETSLGALTDAEVDTLVAIVNRSLPLPKPVNMAVAISALINGGAAGRVATVLSGLLADDREATAHRALAAVGLRVAPGPVAQRALIAHLRVGDPGVRLQVIKSLGTLGDEEALRRLRAVPVPDNEPERRQLAFARALIAHRLGRAERDLPDVRGVSRDRGRPEEMITLTLQAQSPEAIRLARTRLRGSSYGIDTGELGFDLRAGRARWTVFVNRDLDAGAGLGRVFERPWIVALLARWHRPTDTATVQYIALTRPEAESARVDVVRTDGEIVYTGLLERSGGEVRFSVRDVDRPGTAPTNVRGHLTERGAVLDVTVPFGRRINTRTGFAVVARR